MSGSIINLPAKSENFNAYFSPAVSGKGPGVIVLQEWWGLVDHIKDVCDRFAQAGYSALAPDLYQGESADGPDKAGRMMMELNIDKSSQMIVRAVDFLSEHESVTSKQSIGVIGFCMGGKLALKAACDTPKIKAVADFYGVHPSAKPQFEKMNASVLGIFAEKDEFVNAEAVAELKAELEKAGVSHEFEVFSGVDHAFFNDSRPDVYDEASAKKAWQMTLDFFGKEL